MSSSRSKTITFHGPHSYYQDQSCHPLVGVWHGTPVLWHRHILNAHYVSEDQPLDHKFYWHIPAGAEERSLATVRNDAENVLKWQEFLAGYMEKEPESWLVSLFPVVDGSEQLVNECQTVLDEVMAEYSGKASTCKFEGKVTSAESPVEEPFGEWYR